MGGLIDATLRPFYLPALNAGTNFTGHWVVPKDSTDEGGLEKNRMLPPEFEPRTVQPAASRYTDCTIPAPNGMISQRRNAKYLNRSGRGLIECSNGYCVKELSKIYGNFRRAPHSVEIRSTQLSNTCAERRCDSMVLGTATLSNG